MGLQSALRLIYPPQCVSCGGLVDDDFGLCGACWRETHFVSGLVCDSCGTPLPGEDDGLAIQCDDCMALARPWAQGRAALLYRGNARKLVLALKHGGREDLAIPAARWMARAGAPILQRDMIVAPVPLHRLRLLGRRYNQAAHLARGLARLTGLECCPDLLVRRRRTAVQEGMGVSARFENVAGAFLVARRHVARIQGRPVMLVDDVMTSGATLAACAEVCLGAGAASVSVLVLARVAKDF